MVTLSLTENMPKRKPVFHLYSKQGSYRHHALCLSPDVLLPSCPRE